jgi:hypothetical protein
MKQTLFALFSVTLFMVSCSTNHTTPEKKITTFGEGLTLPGDSTVYGLACEGCTDSILVFIPTIGGDPDTIDIFNARVQRRVFGRPEIGDQVAIVLNGNNKDVADLVINIDRLEGKWCYQVMPRLRPRTGASADSIVQLPPDFPDSLRQKWFQPREYGFELRRDRTARPIGMEHRDSLRQRGPVEYPQLKRYRQWYIYNGHLLLCEAKRDTLGNHQIVSTDTADIILMRRDTIRLRFANHEQGYYRQNK